MYIKSIFESFRYQGNLKQGWIFKYSAKSGVVERGTTGVVRTDRLYNFFVFDKIQFITNVRVQAVPKL